MRRWLCQNPPQAYLHTSPHPSGRAAEVNLILMASQLQYHGLVTALQALLEALQVAEGMRDSPFKGKRCDLLATVVREVLAVLALFWCQLLGAE